VLVNVEPFIMLPFFIVLYAIDLALFSCHSINPIKIAVGRLVSQSVSQSFSPASGNCPIAPLYAYPCLSHGHTLPVWQAVFRRITV